MGRHGSQTLSVCDRKLRRHENHDCLGCLSNYTKNSVILARWLDESYGLWEYRPWKWRNMSRVIFRETSQETKNKCYCKKQIDHKFSMVYTLTDHRNDAIKCSKLCSETTRRSALVLNILLNRPQFSMVYTLVDHTNDVIKCSKLKWNHEPQASGFTAKFWTFYGVISMVYKSVDHGKFVVDLFFTRTFIFVSREVSRKITRALVFHIFALSLLFQAPIHCQKCPPHVKIWLFFVHVEE